MRHLLLAFGLAFTPTTAALSQEGKGRDTPSDKAVAKAIEYLANSQDKIDGAWSLNSTKSPAATALDITLAKIKSRDSLIILSR